MEQEHTICNDAQGTTRIRGDYGGTWTFVGDMSQIPDFGDDPVNHPSHYTQGGVECIDAMVSAFGKEAVATFALLNAFKYIWRSDHKGGKEDIEKAVWYLKKYLELKKS